MPPSNNHLHCLLSPLSSRLCGSSLPWSPATRPAPPLCLQDESREGLTYFHETIYSGLPVFLRRIDTALKNVGQPPLPLDAKLFSFGAPAGRRRRAGGRAGAR